jgi:hypothetical protein
MRLFAVALAAAGLTVGVAFAADPAASTDKVYARAAVPDEARKVGEVKLLERDGTTVVETVLSTRVIERVVAEIRLKEEQNWPPGSEGRADMERYVAALTDAAHLLRARIPPADARNIDDPERRAHLVIDFRADATRADVELADFDTADASTPFDPGVRRSLATLNLGRAYVLRNMRLILADAFHRPESDLSSLGPLGPVAKP